MKWATGGSLREAGPALREDIREYVRARWRRKTRPPEYVAFRDYDGAQRDLEMARRFLPNDSSLLVLQGLVSRRQGRWDVGLRDLRRALEIDPRNPGVVRALADTLLEMRQYNAMEKVVKTALAAVQALIAHAQGAFREAQQLLLTAWGEHPRDPTRLSILAQIDAALGQKDPAITRAQEALAARPLSRDSLDAPMLLANLALVYAWSRDLDHAFQELEKIGQQPGGPSYGDLLLNPRWDCLRGDPRFAAILSSARPQD